MNSTLRLTCYMLAAATAASLSAVTATQTFDVRAWVIVVLSGLAAAAAAGAAYNDQGH